MPLFAAATQGWWITKGRIWETAALLLITFPLFRPGYWLDQVSPPYVDTAPHKVYDVVGVTPDDGVLTFVISGPILTAAK